MSKQSIDDYQETILINEAYFSSLIDDVNAAKSSIDLETYIYAEDEFGWKLANALAAAAKRGVNVRVLVDGIGTHNWGGKLTLHMENAGVLTRIFHPLPWLIKHWYRSTEKHSNYITKIVYLISRINSRNHRKTCIIDKNIIYVGSANIISHTTIDKKTNITLRDTTAKLSHINTHKLQYAFEKACGCLSIKNRLRNFMHLIDSDPIFRLNYSWRQRHALYKALLKRIKKCKKRIWITNAYFIPNIFLLRRLSQAAKRGVDVKIILPSKYDFFVLSLLTKTFYTILLNSGVSIYEYTPHFLHAKSLILDDWFCVGSSNLNHRSLKHDLEVDVNIRSQAATAILEKQFLLDLNQSINIHKDEIQKLSLFNKVIGRFLLLLKYWL